MQHFQLLLFLNLRLVLLMILLITILITARDISSSSSNLVVVRIKTEMITCSCCSLIRFVTAEKHINSDRFRNIKFWNELGGGGGGAG